jgi:GDP-L-fucose synthase
MERYSAEDIINVGAGEDISIRELAEMVRDVVGFRGDLVFDRTKPDGTPRKLLDVTRLSALGFRPRVDLREGLRRTYAWYLARQADAGRVRRDPLHSATA